MRELPGSLPHYVTEHRRLAKEFSRPSPSSDPYSLSHNFEHKMTFRRLVRKTDNPDSASS